MDISELHIGDKVRVRRLKDMFATGDLVDDGDNTLYKYDNPTGFTYPMRKLCGQCITIRNISWNNKVQSVSQGNDSGWWWLPEWLEPLDSTNDWEVTI